MSLRKIKNKTSFNSLGGGKLFFYIRCSMKQGLILSIAKTQNPCYKKIKYVEVF